MSVKNRIAVFCSVAVCMFASVGITLSHLVMKHADASHRWVGMAILAAMVTAQIVLLAIAVSLIRKRS